MDISGDAASGGEDQYSPIDKAATASLLNESGGPESSNFLFIHTTGDSAAYKHGNRPEVRSHLTSRAKRAFKEVHKTVRQGKRKAIQSKSRSLGPQPHDSSHPASMTVALSPPRASLTFSIPGNDVLVSGTQGFHTGQEARPGDKTVLDVDPSPFALASGSLNADTRNISEQQKSYESYCKACNRPFEGEDHLNQTFQRMVDVARRYSRKESATPSPIELLGAGRVDPFSSYPMKLNDKGNELLDHRKLFCPQS